VCIQNVASSMKKRSDVKLSLLVRLKEYLRSQSKTDGIRFCVGYFDVLCGLDARLPWMCRGKVEAIVIHDLAVLTHPGLSSESFRQRYRKRLTDLCRRVDLIFVPSRFVQGEVNREISFAQEKVCVVPWGVSEKYISDRKSNGPSKLERYGLSPGYVLFVGVVQVRKNVSLLLDVFSELRRFMNDAKLVIVGGLGYQGQINLSDRIGSMAGVHWLRGVSQEDMPVLYSEANHLLFPSIHEGFGLPALEAMACGTPVVAVNGGALPEVVGDSGIICDSRDTHSFVDSCRLLLTNPERRNYFSQKSVQRAKLFSWEKSTDMIVQRCREKLEKK